MSSLVQTTDSRMGAGGQSQSRLNIMRRRFWTWLCYWPPLRVFVSLESRDVLIGFGLQLSVKDAARAVWLQECSEVF